MKLPAFLERHEHHDEDAPVPTAASLGLMACPHCAAVWKDAEEGDACGRCGTHLHTRKTAEPEPHMGLPHSGLHDVYTGQPAAGDDHAHAVRRAVRHHPERGDLFLGVGRLRAGGHRLHCELSGAAVQAGGAFLARGAGAARQHLAPAGAGQAVSHHRSDRPLVDARRVRGVAADRAGADPGLRGPHRGRGHRGPSGRWWC